MSLFIQSDIIKAACICRPPLLMVFCSVFAPDHRNLFYLFALRPPFQSKHHVAGALKKSDVLFPAHAAFAMLQAYELLLHLSAAVRADLITVSHIIQPALIYIDCGWIPRPYATTGRRHTVMESIRSLYRLAQ